jgi:hypothetical protein
VWGSGCIDPRILDLGTSWRWAVTFTPRPLYLRGKNSRYPSDRRLGGPQSRSGQGGLEIRPVRGTARSLSLSRIYLCSGDSATYLMEVLFIFYWINVVQHWEEIGPFLLLLNLRLGYGLQNRWIRVRFAAKAEIFLFSTATDHLYGSLSLLPNGYRRVFPLG